MNSSVHSFNTEFGIKSCFFFPQNLPSDQIYRNNQQILDLKVSYYKWYRMLMMLLSWAAFVDCHFSTDIIILCGSLLQLGTVTWFLKSSTRPLWIGHIGFMMLWRLLHLIRIGAITPIKIFISEKFGLYLKYDKFTFSLSVFFSQTLNSMINSSLVYF